MKLRVVVVGTLLLVLCLTAFAADRATATDLNARGIAAPLAANGFPMQVRRVRYRLGL